jgi:hypothetical protein
MSARPPMAGRWCGEHGRLECTRRRHGGGTCHGAAVRGGDGACRMHQGKTTARARADALAAWAATPDDDGITPLAAVAGQLGLAWRRAALLGELLDEQVQSQGSDSLAGPLAAAEAAERDRTVRYAAVAHQLGVHEHWVDVARMVGGALNATLDGIFADLELTPAQRARIPLVVPARLRAMRLDDDGGDAA